MIGGNGKPLDLKGFAVLPISLGSNLIWHEFGVVPNLPFEVLIGEDVLVPHLCSLHYLQHNKKRLQFGTQVCPSCSRYRSDPEVGTSTQLRFVDQNPRRRRNRLKVGYHFLATLTEAVCDASKDEANKQMEKITKVFTPSVKSEVPAVMSPATPSEVLSPSIETKGILVTSIHEPTTFPIADNTNGVAPQNESLRSGQLQRVLADLKIATSPIPETIRKQLIEKVGYNLEALAGSSTDLGKTSVVIHTIITKVIPNVLSRPPFAAAQESSNSSYLDRRSLDNIFSTVDPV